MISASLWTSWIKLRRRESQIVTLMSSLITSRVTLCNGYSFSLILLPSSFRFRISNDLIQDFGTLRSLPRKKRVPCNFFPRLRYVIKSSLLRPNLFRLCYPQTRSNVEDQLKKDSGREGKFRSTVHLRFTPAYANEALSRVWRG